MAAIAVQIVRYVDAHQPGFVECALRDAQDCMHLFVEKVPVVSTESLGSASPYPRPGAIACVVQERWQDEQGRSLVRVTTERPWSVKSTSGDTSFVVLAAQVLPGESNA